MPTALALNFHLLKRLGPTRLSVVAYLSPVSGALLGVVLLAKPVSAAMLSGFAIVRFSVALVTDVRLELSKKLRERRA